MSAVPNTPGPVSGPPEADAPAGAAHDAGSVPGAPAGLPGDARPTALWAGRLTALAAVAFGAFVPTSIAGQQVSWIVAFAGLAVLTALGAGGLRRSVLDGPLALHAGALLLSVAFGVVAGADPGERWNVWRLLSIVALGAAFARDRRAARYALVALLTAAGLVSVYGVAQFYTGVDLLRPAARAVRVPAHLTAGRFRPTGTFNWYSTLAFVLMITLGFSAAAFLELARSWRGRALVLAGALPGVAALFFTQVRAAWAGLFVGLLAAAWLRSRRTVLSLAAVALVAGGLAVAAVPAVRAKVVHAVDLDFGSNAHRVFMWVRALEMAGDAPATGIGHGAYTAASRWYYDRFDAGAPVRCHAHNQFLHFWAVAGPMGLVGWIWVLFAFVGAAAGAYRRSRGRDPLAATFAFGGVVAAVGFAVGSLAQDPYFDGEVFYAAAFALAAGIAAVRWTGATEVSVPVAATAGAPDSAPTGAPDPAAAGATIAGAARAVADLALPTLVAVAVGLTQTPWAEALGWAGVLTGAGAATRAAVLVSLAGAAALLVLRQETRRRLRGYGFLWSVGLAAATVVALYVGVVHVLAPAVGLAHLVGPWVPVAALTSLGAAFAARVLARSRSAGPARLALGGVLAAGLAVHLLGPVFAGGIAGSGEAAGGVTAGSADGVAPAGAEGLDHRTVAGDHAAPRFETALAACPAAVVSGRAVVVPVRCAARGDLRLAGHGIPCDRVAAVTEHLAILLCRPPAGQDLLDLAPHRPFAEAAAAVAGPDAAPSIDALLARDTDGDGIPDPADDCLHPDPAQLDSDRDGAGDACEPIVSLAALAPGRMVAGTRYGELYFLSLADGPAAGSRPAPVAATRRYAPAWSWEALGTGDLDGDGRAEILFGTNLSHHLHVLDDRGRKVAKGKFTSKMRWVGFAVGPFAGPDGGPLVAAVQNRHRKVHLLRLEGRALTELTAAALGDAPVTAVATVDLEGDGTAELVTARAGKNGATLEVWRFAGEALLREGPPLALAEALTALVVLPGPVLVGWGAEGAPAAFGPAGSGSAAGEEAARDPAAPADAGSGRETDAPLRPVPVPASLASPVEGGVGAAAVVEDASGRKQVVRYRASDPAWLVD